VILLCKDSSLPAHFGQADVQKDRILSFAKVSKSEKQSNEEYGNITNTYSYIIILFYRLMGKYSL
jgi:hypothetical protein